MEKDEMLKILESFKQEIINIITTKNDESIKESHLVGLQSGKQETSRLAGDILPKVQSKVAEQLENNNKIMLLNMEHYQEESKEWREKADKNYAESKKILAEIKEYIKNDIKWKTEVEPSIQLMKKMEDWSNVSVFLLKTLILIGGAFGVIYGAIKWLKK